MTGENDQTEPKGERGQSEQPQRSTPKPPPPIPDVLLRPVQHSSLEPKPESVTVSAIGDMGKALAIGLDFLFVGAAAALLGWLIDGWLGSSPFGLLIGLCLGLMSGTWRLVARLAHDDRQASKNRTPPPMHQSPNKGG